MDPLFRERDQYYFLRGVERLRSGVVGGAGSGELESRLSSGVEIQNVPSALVTPFLPCFLPFCLLLC
jgi:hypothetical protein